MDSKIDSNSRRRGLDLPRENSYLGRKALDLNRDQIAKHLDNSDKYYRSSNSISTNSSNDTNVNEEKEDIKIAENTTHTNDNFSLKANLENSASEVIELIKILKNDPLSSGEDHDVDRLDENTDIKNEYDDLLLELKEITDENFKKEDHVTKEKIDIKKFLEWLTLNSSTNKILEIEGENETNKNYLNWLGAENNIKINLSLSTCEDLFSCNESFKEKEEESPGNACIFDSLTKLAPRNHR